MNNDTTPAATTDLANVSTEFLEDTLEELVEEIRRRIAVTIPLIEEIVVQLEREEAVQLLTVLHEISKNHGIAR